MAPTRKSRSVNKRYANEASPVKDVSSSSRSKQKKKLSDKLGPQWSKGELQRFYEAYRNYGKDWKKVAAQVRNRSVEMVEALYNMNRAYLSLPEGTASVVGLIAMMTDHYNVLEGSDSERESNDASSIPQKSQKRKRGKHQLGASKEDVLMSWSMASTDGCLSLLKRARSDGSQPRAVKKRTPRIPVSYSYKKDNRVNYTLLNNKKQESEVDANDDEVAHVAALALTEASQRGGSPQVSQSPYKRTEHGKSSPVQSWDKTTAHAKLCAASLSEERSQGRTGSRKPENGFSARDRSSMPMEGVGTVEVHRKGKKIYRKKMKVEEVRNSLSDDGAEACSGTEEGTSALKGKADTEVLNAKHERFPPRGQRKKKKKLFFGDENSSLDALQTLADLSLMFPDSTMESESSAQLKEERTVTDMDDKSSAPEATSTSIPDKLSGPKEKAMRTITEVEGVIPRKSKQGRYSDIDVEVVTEAKEQPEPLSNSMKKRRKPIFTKKSSNAEALADSHLNRTLESEASPGGDSKISIKGKRTNQVSAQSKQWKPGRVLEASAISSDQKRARIDLVASTAQLPAASQGSKQRRQKMHLQRKFSSKELKPSESILKNQPNKCLISQQDKVISPKAQENLSCCLSSELVRRWCTFEWFYSAIDYPWFANREFVEYLNHVGLGHIPRLTRVELGVIRSSLGKPRRFSERFLRDEREKLKHYRESVRKHYAELRTGIREGLPRDLPRPLSVGQRVIAIHPKTRELHDGSVLTVDHDKCRVRFDHSEIGVEFVMDIDCMPSNTFDNIPEALRRQFVASNKLSAISKEPQVNGHPNFGGPIIYASGGHMEKAPITMDTLLKQTQGDTNCAIPQAKSVATDIASAQQAYGQPCTVAQIQEREVDIRAVSELYHSLAKKEVLLMELKNTNNDIMESHNGGDGSVKDSEPLRKHIATASSALLHLRQRNTYPESSLPPWLKLPANSSFLGSLTNTFDNSYASQESGPAVIEIVRGSRLRAHTMVDTAIKALSSIKEGEDAYIRIGEALDHIDKRQFISDSRVPVIRSPEQVNGSLSHHNQFVSGAAEPLLTSYASGPKFQDGSNKNETQIPSELITSCVATMLMIQTCTERQYPPAYVAQIIDSAVSSLHPCCPQNLPIYREIEMCMGRIKTQILALIPT
ncbi:protein ALWAYS EARLY 2 isoform X2 [Pistacia vera]|uniref:protein ALWAYS EARLY 2 isoform X2 n=1 Tax=Pistacia vera TaxID=55513 RepID=UPI001263ACCB|nr:protein ALWAYS EARLY 2 isoform X2 [Pistacia vera]